MGIVKSKAPGNFIAWNNETSAKLHSLNAAGYEYDFSVGKGMYTTEQVREYEKLLVFPSHVRSIISKITLQASGEGNSMVIKPQNIFPTFTSMA